MSTRTKPINLEKLVEYHDGSVVSREILRTSFGTVTLFSFDQGQGLSEHTAPFDALLEVIDGEAVITLSGIEHILKKGEIIIMPSGEPHAVKAVSKLKMLLTMIKDK